MVEVRLGRVLDVFLKFKFHPRGIGKVLNNFKEVTLWGSVGNVSNVEDGLKLLKASKRFLQ